MDWWSQVWAQWATTVVRLWLNLSGKKVEYILSSFEAHSSSKHPPESSILLRILISWQSWFGLLEKTDENLASSLSRNLLFKERDIYHQILFFPFRSSTLLDPGHSPQTSVSFDKSQSRKFYPTCSLKPQHFWARQVEEVLLWDNHWLKGKPETSVAEFWKEKASSPPPPAQVEGQCLALRKTSTFLVLGV